MSDFIVRFHGIELSEKQQAHLQAAIQRTVLTEVSVASAFADDPDGDICGTYWPPRHWLGIVLLPQDRLAELPAINQSVLQVQSVRAAAERE